MNHTRGLSTALGYVLTLSVTVILVSGLFIAGGNFVESQREEVIRTEMDIVGEQVASHINAADRLNQSGMGESTIRIEQRFPARVVGSSYQIYLEEDEPQLRLESSRPQVEATVPLTNTTALADSSASGGEIIVRYDQDEDAVVIDSA
jgi:N-methylhydantoinase A/oxoprolinase/acetone carboxylase beta subunit